MKYKLYFQKYKGIFEDFITIGVKKEIDNDITGEIYMIPGPEFFSIVDELKEHEMSITYTPYHSKDMKE